MHPREFGTWKVVLISIEFRLQLISQNQKIFCNSSQSSPREAHAKLDVCDIVNTISKMIKMH
jgi:hypothetical protein